jgi:predicted nucleic acid-binding protein
LTLLDANALLSLLLGQPAEKQVSSLLRRGNCAIPAACLAEVVDALVRTHGIEPISVSERLGALIDEVLAVLPMDQRTAWRAGELRAIHYHRVDSALSLADCLLLAVAGRDDEIATSDRAVAATAHRLGLGLIPLLDSNGERPSVE